MQFPYLFSKSGCYAVACDLSSFQSSFSIVETGKVWKVEKGDIGLEDEAAMADTIVLRAITNGTRKQELYVYSLVVWK